MNTTNIDTREIQILSTGVRLEGMVSIPEEAQGLVVFVHGSGSSRHSPRNQFVARTLRDGGLATVLFDLLTPGEGEMDERTGFLRFDVDLLARRTAGALEWLGLQPFSYGRKRGLFGSSTGAAAALVTAVEIPELVDAVVSRGGRPDLAGEALGSVLAPTLFIVGGHDEVVVDLNEQALARMRSETQKELTIVPGATHLFEEPGALEEAAHLARDWFQKYLSPVSVN